MSAHEEEVPNGVVIWQSERAKTYLCPTCLQSVRTQYEGEESPTEIICRGFMAGHLVRWELKAVEVGDGVHVVSSSSSVFRKP